MLIHKGTQRLETPRLILRQAIPEDAKPMFRNWASDPAVTRYLTWPTHENQETTDFVLNLWLADYEKPDYYQWMIVPKDVGEPIGTISVVRLEDKAEEAEIGYCIGKKWWYRGYVSEALSAVIQYLFKEVGLNCLTAGHDVNNPNSGAVMRKCGMKYEGTAAASGRNNQGVCDMANYAILREDWETM
jgi:ribosomal-protein-alanine N-acetyltransferase